MTDTLATFLLARIDEDVEAANAADLSGSPHYPESMAPAVVRHSAGAGSTLRVRREAAAKRSIIELHRQWPVLVEAPPTFEPTDPLDINAHTFRATAQIAWLTEQEYRNRFGSEPPTTPMLRAMASVYADHSDFREEWASDSSGASGAHDLADGI